MNDENFEKWLDSYMNRSDTTWREFILENFEEDTLYAMHDAFIAGFKSGMLTSKEEYDRIHTEIRNTYVEVN
jgi:hypothetical protein